LAAMQYQGESMISIHYNEEQVLLLEGKF
jgi:hypothetical protein